MFRNLFIRKIAFSPGEAFAEIAAGQTGWFWPLTLYCSAAAASALLLCGLPPDFLAEVTGGVQLIAGKNFLFYLAIGLAGGLFFTLFFCALLTAFLPFIRNGLLPVRLACLVLGTAAYGFFFLLPFHALPSYTWTARLLAGLALGFAIRTILVNWQLYSRLIKAVLSLSFITLAADAAGAAALLTGTAEVYTYAQYACALWGLAYIIKAASLFFNATTARCAAAIVPAMLASAAFLFSLSALGLISPEIFQAILLI